MPFANAIATLFLVLNNLSKYMTRNTMLSMDLRWPRTVLSSQKMFTMAKKLKWTVVESILIDYHTMKMNTFVAMDESLHQMNVNNLLSIRDWSNVWPSYTTDPWLQRILFIWRLVNSIRPKIILFWISVIISDHAQYEIRHIELNCSLLKLF